MKINVEKFTTNDYQDAPSEEQNFSTHDLGLVAYLLCLGYDIEDMDRGDPGRVEFTIRKDSQLEDLAKDFWSNSAKVDPLAYFNNLKRVKNQIYSTYQ